MKLNISLEGDLITSNRSIRINSRLTFRPKSFSIILALPELIFQFLTEIITQSD